MRPAEPRGAADMELSPIRLFVSYAQEDARHMERFAKHLSSLVRAGVLESWHDRLVLPGMDWEAEVDSNLLAAHMVAVLLSPDFVASDYCFDTEMASALIRHAEGGITLVPILIRPTALAGLPIAALQRLPRNGQSVRQRRDADQAWAEIVDELRAMALAWSRRLAEAASPAVVNQRQGAKAGKPAKRLRVARKSPQPLPVPSCQVYVTSELWDFTVSVEADLDAPAGLLIDRLLEGFELPRVHHHANRAGVNYEYALIHRSRELDRKVPLRERRVTAGAILELETRLVTFSEAAPHRGKLSPVVFRGGAGQPPSNERAALAAARRLLTSALRDAGLVLAEPVRRLR